MKEKLLTNPGYTKYKIIEVNVTQEDIDRGVRYNCTYCPIAKAMYRLVAFDLTSNDNYLTIDNCVRLIEARGYGSLSKYIIKLPTIAHRFIAAFDLGYACEPFKFGLIIPEDKWEFFKPEVLDNISGRPLTLIEARDLFYEKYPNSGNELIYT